MDFSADYAAVYAASAPQGALLLMRSVRSNKAFTFDKSNKTVVSGCTQKRQEGGEKMAGKTISFPKGDGSLTHNNRDFIAKNVCPERTCWNKTYIRQSIAEAYEKCFGEAVREYNAGQKRNDRKINNYVKKIENSDNKENVFYENIVQLGTKYDTSVVDENGKLTEAAKEAVDLLDEYARTFQERNPNLYLFNCVLHLDEATPHLHIDYIPVADGYKKGMKTRNSISKALQQMGFEKGKGRYDNEVINWEARERDYLMSLCRERGIEVEVKGDKRDNLTLPEYKAAMRKVECLEAEAEKLDKQNETLELRNESLQKQASDLHGQVQEMEAHNNELVSRAQELAEQIKEAEAKEKVAQEVLAKHDLRADIFKMISKEVAVETKNMKGSAVPVTSLFSNEEYVKVKKSDWNKILDAFNKAVSRNYLLEKYEKKIAALEKKLADLAGQAEKLKRFVASKGLAEEFVEFVKRLVPKTMKQKLEDARVDAAEHNRQRKMQQQILPERDKRWQQEM